MTVLVLCFAITASCTFWIIFTTGKLQHKANAKNTCSNNEPSSVAREDTSPVNVKLKRARPSPECAKSGTPFSLQNDSDLERRASPPAYSHGVEPATNGFIFVDSSASESRGEGGLEDSSASEDTPLLLKRTGREPREVVASEDVGLWYRDIAGKHLLRFIVLLLLLIFSSLVVSYVYTAARICCQSIVKFAAVNPLTVNSEVT